MKTLKFMLAAATAIGFASATQADQYNTTGFEKLTVGDAVTTGVLDNDSSSYFYYAGSTAADNESVIAAADAELANIARPRGAAAVDAGRDKILQVSTGEDPLLRTYAPLSNGEPQEPSTLTADAYVDTLVQFTVTPYTDTVAPGAADKLMIYLKESTNEVNDVLTYTTNLVVVGKYHDVDSVVKEYKVDGLVVDGVTTPTEFEPNKWYRLTVKVLKNVATTGKYPGFMVYIDGKVCVFDSPTANMNASSVSRYYRGVDAVTAKQVVLSLLANGTTDASLQAVGFAGEGKVDDIVFSDLNPFATVFDFTFSFDTAAGVSSVTYTVGGTEYNQAQIFPEVESNTVVTITAINYATGYEADAITPVGLTAAGENSWTVTSAGASLTVTAQEKQETPLKPGEQDPTTYTTFDEATNAAAKVVIGVPTAVETAFAGDTEKTAAYRALFAAKAVSDGAGGYKVEVGLTAAAEATLQDQVDDDAAEVIADLSDDEVTLTTTPGLYYSFEYGTSLEGMAEVGTRQLATGGTLKLTRPTTEDATAGFYKVLVNIAPAPVTP